MMESMVGKIRIIFRNRKKCMFVFYIKKGDVHTSFCFILCIIEFTTLTWWNNNWGKCTSRWDDEHLPSYLWRGDDWAESLIGENVRKTCHIRQCQWRTVYFWPEWIKVITHFFCSSFWSARRQLSTLTAKTRSEGALSYLLCSNSDGSSANDCGDCVELWINWTVKLGSLIIFSYQ